MDDAHLILATLLTVTPVDPSLEVRSGFHKDVFEQNESVEDLREYIEGEHVKMFDGRKLIDPNATQEELAFGQGCGGPCHLSYWS